MSYSALVRFFRLVMPCLILLSSVHAQTASTEPEPVLLDQPGHNEK